MNALNLALYYLGRRARTEQELRTKLAGKKVPTVEIDQVMAKLKSLGYVDDLAFAANFQRSRDNFKPMGSRRIKMELRQKGVPKEIIERVAAEPEKELELALEAAKTRLRQYANLDQQTFTRRMMSFLARRGFGYDTIKRVLIEIQGNNS